MVNVLCTNDIGYIIRSYIYKQNKRGNKNKTKEVIILKISDQCYKHILKLIVQWLYY